MNTERSSLVSLVSCCLFLCCVVFYLLRMLSFIFPASRQNSSKKAKGGAAGGKDRNCSESFSEFDKLKAHLKASHEGSEWPWICGFCDLVLLYDLEFEVHIKQHTDKPPFGCPICSRLFSDNSRLREHLARQHLPSRDSQASAEALNTAPTASVGSPGLSSAAQIKSKQPQLTQEQLEAFEKLRNSSMTDGLQATRRGRSQDMTADAILSSASAASNVKDEAAVSRELAALLLNLHDSNGRLGPQQSQPHNSAASINVPKAEDLSLKSSVETAIDLTKSKPEITLTPTMPASITKLVKGHNNSNNSSSASNNGSSGVTVTKTSVKAPSYPASSASGGSGSAAAQAQSAAASAYPFYPSLASMTSLSPTLAMNSNYLLHNLLLGKFQQIANSSNSASTASTASPASASTAAGGNGNGGAAGSTTSTTVSSQNMASLPTHPLPAQALTMPTSKPPASVLKSASSQQSATSNGTSGSRSATTSNAAAAVAAANAAAAESAAAVAANAAGYSSLQLLSDTSSASASANGLDIPYMCRQIVTLLNGLLFHQHNLNNHTVEMNVHTQLGAIYTRLQEVVVMVEQAKKQQEAAKVAAATVAAVAKKEEKHLKVSLSQIIPKLKYHLIF